MRNPRRGRRELDDVGLMAPGSRSALTRPALVGALSSALLLTLAQPPFSVLPLAFLSLVPLALGLASLPPGPVGRWQATLLGLLFGVAFWGFALIWVPLEVGPFFPWAYSGYALLLVLLGSLFALFGWMAHFFHKTKAIPLGLALPLAWVGVEWAKAHFPFGLAFPWLGLGVTLTDWPHFLGLAEWAGEEGVAFWLSGVNGLVAGRILGRGSRRKVAPWLLLGGVVLLPSVLGVVRARTLPLETGPRVVVVGTHVPPELRGSPAAAVLEAMAQVEEALRGFHSGTIDLVVLPEATVPFPMDGQEAIEAREILAQMISELDAPIVVGAFGRADSEAAEGVLTNSAYLLSPWDPQIQRYDKSRLVPGMESRFVPGMESRFVPGIESRFVPGIESRFVPGMESGSYRAGSGRVTLKAGEWVVGPLLCYESIFGGLAREGRRAGAQLLLNLSSDIWFGRDNAGVGSLFLHQHPAHLVLRAVENRTPVARAANGGLSFLIDPTGHIISEVIPPTGGVTVGRVSIYQGLTLFSRTGDWVGPASALLCILLLFVDAGPSMRRRFRRPRVDS